jgi:hypothetical protein
MSSPSGRSAALGQALVRRGRRRCPLGDTGITLYSAGEKGLLEFPSAQRPTHPQAAWPYGSYAGFNVS